MATSGPAIEVAGAGRTYGSGANRVTALDDVSFTVAEGEIVALLGANGAGKTTLVKILATLLLPTTGRVLVFGADVVDRVKEVRRRVGVVFGGDRGLYTRLSGRENLRFFGMLAGVPRAELRTRAPAMLERVGLAEVADRRVETYSRGMRQRLHIAIGLLPRPRVLLLDEPTTGLDPTEAERLRDTVSELRHDGVSVLLTSHHLLDVERLTDRVVMLREGTVAADLPLAEFAALAGYAAAVTVTIRHPLPELEALLPAEVDVVTRSESAEGTTVELRLPSWGGGMFGRLGALLDRADVVDVQVRPARLEEAFTSFLTRRA
ncbi:ABC transporter ATP-binding protein [Amycolatopsis sp. FBCC-B4732]|uniref:ABC transporter ATP-binding protein n=1 Tax=Amycolatopsis sp. FBCC-B4732 TaxID=3079339 RepID=UPI001FF5CF8D|nr:ABC transporter ATP-binding protein [Amycolatopsis sp. FBCC-B4732]UOX90701.1 ABC transporter ATP-binding protein [Amycolatopsis sp. FBCC-B4732]